MRFTIALAATLATAQAWREGIAGYSRTESFAGHKVLQCEGDGNQKLWQRLSDEHKLDVWGETVGGVAIQVKNAVAEKAVRSHFMDNCTVAVEDVEAQVLGWERELLAAQSLPAAAQGQAPSTYQTYANTAAWYRSLAAANPALVTFEESIGSSVEGRAMPAVRITGNAPSGDKRHFYIQCQIHAREWISGATCMWVANQLVTDYQRGSDQARFILDNAVIALVPFVNPDGYDFTWTSNRLWRKSRRVTAPNSALFAGVDLNRNYDDFWGQGGSSTLPFAEDYMGPSPASEPETQATVRYFQSLQAVAPVLGALDMHAFSQLILRPYGRGTLLSPDEVRLRDLGAAMQQAIRSSSGREYRNIRSVELYITTGSAGDWMYGNQATAGNGGFKIGAYTYELRPLGAIPGFQLPAEEIPGTGNEVYASLVVWMTSLIRDPIRA